MHRDNVIVVTVAKYLATYILQDLALYILNTSFILQPVCVLSFSKYFQRGVFYYQLIRVTQASRDCPHPDLSGITLGICQTFWPIFQNLFLFLTMSTISLFFLLRIDSICLVHFALCRLLGIAMELHSLYILSASVQHLKEAGNMSVTVGTGSNISACTHYSVSSLLLTWTVGNMSWPIPSCPKTSILDYETVSKVNNFLFM